MRVFTLYRNVVAFSFLLVSFSLCHQLLCFMEKSMENKCIVVIKCYLCMFHFFDMFNVCRIDGNRRNNFECNLTVHRSQYVRSVYCSNQIIAKPILYEVLFR